MKLLGQRSLIRKGGSPTARSENDGQHQGGREPGFDGMANTGELLLNAVKINKLKMLTSLDQKVRGQENEVCHFFSQTARPPANRQSLTHQDTYVKRGKPVALPHRESEPQGSPIGQRVEDEGRSERSSVMEEIRIERSSGAKAG